MNSRAFWLVILFLTSLGCNRMDSNPEMTDPIYLDLIKEQREYSSLLDETEKKIVTLEKEYEKSEPRTIERKNSLKDLKAEQAKREKALQLIEYYSIRSEKRKYDARASYRKYFEKGIEWPPKEEFEAYKTHKRLTEASRNWDDRVPRSTIQQTKVLDPGEEKKEGNDIKPE